MRRSMLISMVLCLLMVFCTACALAEGAAPLWQPLLDQWNAQTGEELHVNLCAYMKEHTRDDPGICTPKYMPCQIRIGGTTEELLADKKNWDMAIVSSKDVDLNKLIEAELLYAYGYMPESEQALHEWLLPEEARALLPYDSNYIFSVYVYDYCADTGEALLLLDQNDRWRKKSNYLNCAYQLIPPLLHSRPAEQARRLQGINVVYDWPAEELLNRATEWDVALQINISQQDIEALEQAQLLMDFSSIPYFAARPATSVTVNHETLTNAIYGKNGGIIAVPYNINGSSTYTMLINTWGSDLDRAKAFAEHMIRSYEWYSQAEHVMPPKHPYGYPRIKTLHISREDVDW